MSVDSATDAREAAVEVAPKRPELSGPDRLLLLSALAGPLAWACQLMAAVPMVPWMCHRGLRWPLHALTLAVVVVIALAVAHCWLRLGGEREARTTSDPAHEQLDAPPLARRAIAWAGVALGVFFLLLALASDVPGLILEPCR